MIGEHKGMDAGSILGTVFYYLKLVLLLSLRQFIFLFALTLLLSYLIQLINRRLLKNSWQLLGGKPYLWLFGWFSIPVHELGHAIFAVIFGHKITRIVLFDPQASSGSHGFVQHSWNQKNVYHRVGNLFIGIGPIIFGSTVIWLLARWLLQAHFQGFDSLDAQAGVWQQIQAIPYFLVNSLSNTLLIFQGIFSSFSWKTALFLYLSFAISTNINLSELDIGHIKPALTVIIQVILAFNLLTAWMGDFTLALMDSLETGLSSFYGILVYVLVLNLGFLILTWIASMLFKK